MNRALLQQILRYDLVRFGVVGVIVMAVFMFLNWLLGRWLGQTAAFLVSYVPAVALHFQLNKRWTFGSARTDTTRQAGEYLGMVLVTFLIQVAIFKAVLAYTPAPGWLAAGLANVVQMGVTFCVMRWVVFTSGAPPRVGLERVPLGEQTHVPPPGLRARAALALLETLFIVPLWLGMDFLAHLRLSPAVFGWTMALAWGAPRLGVALLRERWGWLERWGRIPEIVVPWAILLAAGGQFRRPLSAAEATYAVGLVALAVEAWRFALARAGARGCHPVAEAVRRLVLMTGALWPVSGFFTRQLMGGVDARWYAYMLQDAIAQFRAGVFPVFLGQTEWAWSGAAHPFRTAPLYPWLGGALDFLTARALPLFSLQHLVVLLAALAGAFGIHATVTTLAPGRRWAAVGFGVLYANCPGLVTLIVVRDMYMTYVAIAILPAVLCGNLLTLTRPDGRGYLLLAIGLSAAWYGHALMGLIASTATLILQAGLWIFGEFGWARVRSAVRAAALGVGLSAYYFYSMSELPKSSTHLLSTFLFLGGAILAWWGVARGLVAWRPLHALALAPAALMLHRVNPAWAWWLACFVPLGAGLGLLARRLRGEERSGHGIDALWIAALAATIPATWLVGSELPGHDAPALELLRERAAKVGAYFAPLSRRGVLPTDIQPGLGLAALAALGVVIALWSGSRPAKLVAGLAVYAVLFLIPAPVVSPFLLGYLPFDLLYTAAIPIALRCSPVICLLLVGTAILALAALPARGNAARLALAAVLLAGAWSAWEARKFVGRQVEGTLPTAMSEAALRSENVMLHRFTYDLLSVPSYFSEGKLDPRLENRLFTAMLQPAVGPDEVARRMEERGSERRVLESVPFPTAPDTWLLLSPPLTVRPGEHLLLRFEWEPGVYDGHLIFGSKRGSYREYQLPASGMSMAFGVGPAASRVLSIWNSGDVAETYEISFKRGPAHQVGVPSGRFATIHLSRFDPAFAPVTVESWLPYRARVRLDAPGFLETPRILLPGYRVTVDGEPVEPIASKERLLMIPLGAGEQVVEVRFAGTWKLWLSWLVSAAAWLAVAVVGLARLGKAEAGPVGLPLPRT